jgi:hypothetical protein
VQVGDEREQWPGEAFPESQVTNQGRQLGLDEPDVRVEPGAEWNSWGTRTSS